MGSAKIKVEIAALNAACIIGGRRDNVVQGKVGSS